MPANQLCHFRKKVSSGPAVAMADKYISGLMGCTLIIANDGTVRMSNDQGQNYLDIGPWLTSGLVADVEVMVTKTGTGIYSGATLGAWLLLSTTRSFGVTTADSLRAGTFALSFRNRTTLAQLDTATVDYEVAGNFA